jgi:lipopolysaccharide transport system ATP-binding protein
MIENDIILSAENISKQYRLGQVGTGTISHDLNHWWHKIRGKENPYLKIGEINDRSTVGTSDYVWAIQDINFEVKRGEILGIIGKNGAGKSTLLKILSRVTSPTRGTIKTKGRIASLLEVGTGFHGEMTGRENIYLNGAILGMTKKEINSKIDEIIEFSGCQRYIDTPVKRYSSGMTVRLGFAVAAFLEPEILVVDEVLAVGDAEFQKKAIGKMQDISREGGRTVLFVSHNMAAVKSLCTRGILLENGLITKDDNIEKVISHYLDSSRKENPKIIENEICLINYVVILNSNSQKVTNISNGEDFIIQIDFKIKENDPDLGFCIAIYNELEELISAINTYHFNETIKNLKTGHYKLNLKLNKYIFNTGIYKLNLHINNSSGNLYNLIEDISGFLIYDDGLRRGNKYNGEWPGKISIVPKIEINEIL